MSAPASEREQLRQALDAAFEHAPARRDCPDPDRIWSAARGEAAPSGIREVVEHVATCAQCAEAWDLACELAAEASTREAPVSKASSPGALPPVARWPRRAMPWLAAAAVLALIVALPILQLGPERTRGGGEGIESMLAAGAALSRDAVELRWSGPARAERYELRVSWSTERDSGLVAAAELPAAEGEMGFRIVPEDLAGVPAGALLQWQVTALGGGERLAERTFVTALR